MMADVGTTQALTYSLMTRALQGFPLDPADISNSANDWASKNAGQRSTWSANDILSTDSFNASVGDLAFKTNQDDGVALVSYRVEDMKRGGDGSKYSYKMAAAGGPATSLWPDMKRLMPLYRGPVGSTSQFGFNGQLIPGVPNYVLYGGAGLLALLAFFGGRGGKRR